MLIWIIAIAAGLYILKNLGDIIEFIVLAFMSLLVFVTVVLLLLAVLAALWCL
mgnify:CR=1 FL=1